ncbi:GNAT family N-acetyltransferase [uncultured Williamsia sp.]|uniref:GNAT family N-acetyltransferase n=1 Tax=uncultured Williamsia sp. TaxID=259311 RepID=UPI002615BEF0|nr:GNAT family N-acetyltransferase [uncultured Williamsia sp.]
MPPRKHNARDTSFVDGEIALGDFELSPWRDSDRHDFARLLEIESDIVGQMALDYYDSPEKLLTAFSRWEDSWTANHWGPYAIRRGAELVGFAGPHPVPGHPYPIWSGALAARYRRQGLGSAAVEAIGRRLQLSGSRTFAKASNAAVNAALIKAGWIQENRERYGDADVIWYRRDDWLN